MKYENTLQYTDAINQLVKRNSDIIKLAKTENRELTEDEEKEFDKNEEEVKELEDEKQELEKSLENPDNEDKEEKSNKNINVNNMEKKSSYCLVDEIKRSMTTHEPIILTRSTMTVAAEGEDVVATDLWDVWAPLRQENVLAKAGMQVRTGLVGDVQIPLYSKGNVAWKGETASAEDGNGSFTSVSLSPKRITGKFPISLQFLAQTTPDVEAVIREDIAKAVGEKIEATILGSAAGSSTQPAGLAYNVAATEVSDYSYLTTLEAGLEENQFNNISFIVSPKAKASFKSMIKGTNATGMVYDGGEVDGYKTEMTTNVPASYFFAGDFSQVVCGLWDEVRLDVVADSATLADGQIMIIVNAFADAKQVREGAIKYGKVA